MLHSRYRETQMPYIYHLDSYCKNMSYVLKLSDIDECEAIPGLCEGGLCVNSIGSFKCECPEGETRNPETNACEDLDECEQDNICLNGRCINTDGSYYCSCNTGFIPTQNRKSCIGMMELLYVFGLLFWGQTV